MKRMASTIENMSACDTDFTDESLQTIEDRRQKGPVLCDNLQECRRRSQTETISCYRLLAQQMAPYLLQSCSIQQEKEDFLQSSDDVKRFWVKKNGKWRIVEGKENIVDDVVDFALVILNAGPGDYQLPSKTGTVLGPVPQIDLEQITEEDAKDLQRLADSPFSRKKE